jgi:hypothetical protein
LWATYPESGLQCIRVLLLEVQNDLQIQGPSNTKAFPKLDEKLLAVLDASEVGDGVGILEGLAVDVERPNLAVVLERSLNGYNHVVPGHRRGDEKIEPFVVKVRTV